MLLCRRDLRIGVLALKSLLRFADGRLAVTLTDDGTLSVRDRRWASMHIPGSRWLSWPTRDLALGQVLTDQPRLAALYRSRYAPVCKLIHTIALARCQRTLVLDPDTAFFERPDRLLDWAFGNDLHAWYLHDHQDEAQAVPVEAREGFADLEANIVPDGQQWGLPIRLFNSGLLAFRPDRLDLDMAEQYLAWLETAPERFKTGKAAIWFGSWTPEQTCYHVMFALTRPAPKPLGDDYHLGGQPGHVFNHFLRHYLVREETLDMLRHVIRQL